MEIDRKKQNAIAQRLYAADPERGRLSDSACWVAACFTAYALVAEQYSAEQYKFILDYYGPEACQ